MAFTRRAPAAASGVGRPSRCLLASLAALCCYILLQFRLTAAPAVAGDATGVARQTPTLPTVAVSSLPPSEVVLAFAMGYRRSQVRSFVLSLRLGGFTGEIRLGVSPDMDPATAAFYREQGVDAVSITPEDSARAVHPKAVRYLKYGEWLGSMGPETRVLLTDVRDVVFQASPFAARWPRHEVHLFGEYGRLGDYPVNMDWVRRCWTKESGTPSQAWYENRTLINSGVMLGTARGLGRVARAVYAEIEAHPSCFSSDDFHDQGFLNHLYYARGAFPHAVLSPQGHGPVHTIGEFRYHSRVDRGARLLRDQDGFVVDRRGARVPVVHQYDRWASLLNPWVADALSRPFPPPRAAPADVVASAARWFDRAEERYALESCYTYEGGGEGPLAYSIGRKFCKDFGSD